MDIKLFKNKSFYKLNSAIVKGYVHFKKYNEFHEMLDFLNYTITTEFHDFNKLLDLQLKRNLDTDKLEGYIDGNYILILNSIKVDNINLYFDIIFDIYESSIKEIEWLIIKEE